MVFIMHRSLATTLAPVLWHGKNHKQFNRNREVFVLHLGYTDNVFLSRLITWACFFYTCNKDYMKLMMKKER